MKRHLVDGLAVSELCDKVGIKPQVFYQWQKQFFERGAITSAVHYRPL